MNALQQSKTDSGLFTYGLGLLFLLAAGLKWAWALPAHSDLLFGDEVEYMRNGVDLFSIIRNDWGPAYNLWYKFLSLFTADPIHLYYLNYAAGAILSGLLLFIVLVRYRINTLIALYLSFCFLISDLNINTWPRVSHFIVIILLLSLAVASFFATSAKKCLVLATGCFISAYARPDLLFPFFIMLILSLFFIYKERSQFKSYLPFIVILLLVIIFFQGMFGLPAANYRGEVDRMYIAFGQHFTVNYKQRTHVRMDAVTDWLVFCRQYFAGCNTFSDILHTHPGDVLQNCLFNLKNYFFVLISTITSFIFPEKILHYKKLSYLFLLGLLAAVLYISFSKKKREPFMGLLRTQWLTLLLLFIFGLTSMGMCILIFPRQHYILLHSLFLIFLLACIGQSLFGDFSVRWYISAAALAVVLFISPTAGKYNYLQVTKDMDNLCSQKLIRYLEAQTDKPYTIFSSILNVTYPLPKNYSEFNTEYELKEGMQFSDVLKQQSINMILMMGSIEENPVLRKDSTWIRFLANPGEMGFKKVKFSDLCEGYIFEKESN